MLSHEKKEKTQSKNDMLNNYCLRLDTSEIRHFGRKEIKAKKNVLFTHIFFKHVLFYRLPITV